MKTFRNYLLIMASALFLATGCEPEPQPDPQDQPSVKLEASEKGTDWLEFKITPEKAEEAAWVCVKSAETVPSADEILSTGTQADAAKASTAKAEGLEAETEYAIVAAVRNGELTAVSEVLKMTTSAADIEKRIVEVTFGGANAEKTEEAAEGKYTVAFLKDGSIAMKASFTAEAGDRLPAGTYEMAGNLSSASIAIDGKNVTPASGSIIVELDGDNYSMTMQFVIDDQCDFKGTFEGKIEGYPIVKDEEPTEQTFYYSTHSNWGTGDFGVAFKLNDKVYRINFYNPDYYGLRTGVYTFEEGADYYINPKYSYVETPDNPAVSGTVEVEYDPYTYQFSCKFDITSANGKRMLGVSDKFQMSDISAIYY